MDGYHELSVGQDHASATSEPLSSDQPLSASDERRMQVRAYNYWASLLDGRDFPSIEDLEPASVADFAKHSVLLDFTSGSASPVTAYIGAALRHECDLDPEVESMAEVPAGSLLARLTGYHGQILDSRAPVGIEAEFVNQRGVPLSYRGILMPFSSDGETIDFVYGVFSWAETDSLRPPTAQEAPASEPAPVVEAPVPHMTWQDGPLKDPEVLQGSPEATLADWLTVARATAEDAKAADGRSRVALYRALSLAYDFACAAVETPEDYDALLAASGIIVQARAPMTAVAKLVFGIDYDKARLTEYAAALSHAARQGVAGGEFLSFIEQYPGGLKGLVEAERRVRRPDSEAPDWRERVWTALREAAPRPLDALAGNGEFALVLVRRDASGEVAPVAAISDPLLLDKALRKAAA